MEGEGEEALDSVRPGFPVAELVDYGLVGDGSGRETLALAKCHESLRGRQERLGGDHDPLGLVGGAAQRRGGGGAYLRLEEGLGGDGEVAVVGLGVPGQTSLGGGAG